MTIHSSNGYLLLFLHCSFYDIKTSNIQYKACIECLDIVIVILEIAMKCIYTKNGWQQQKGDKKVLEGELLTI